MLSKRPKPPVKKFTGSGISSCHMTTDEIEKAIAYVKSRDTHFQGHWVSGLCSTGEHRWKIEQQEVTRAKKGRLIWAALIVECPKEFTEVAA